MTAFDDIASAIIIGQRTLIGPVAITLASKVPGVSVGDEGRASVSGDGATVIDALVREYSTLTGPLGVRMCFQAAKSELSRHPEVSIPSFASF